MVAEVFAQLIRLTLADVANVFAAAVAVIAAMVVPYSLYALFKYEKRPQIRATRADPDAHFRPSLFSLTWLTRVHVFGTAIVLLNYFLRIAYKLDTGEGPGQPLWSYPMSMFTATVILAVLVTPAVFLTWVKQQILENPEPGQVGRDNRRMLREIQAQDLIESDLAQDDRELAAGDRAGDQVDRGEARGDHEGGRIHREKNLAEWERQAREREGEKEG